MLFIKNVSSYKMHRSIYFIKLIQFTFKISVNKKKTFGSITEYANALLLISIYGSYYEIAYHIFIK